MSLTAADVLRWDPEAVQQVGFAARSRAQISLQAAGELESLPLNQWTGAGADAAKQAISETIKALRQDADQSLAAAKALDAAAEDISNVRDALAQLYQTATAQGLALDPVSGTIAPAKAFVTPQDWHHAQVLQAALNQLLRQADEVDQRLAAAIHAAEQKVNVPPAAYPIPMPPPGATADEVNQWWRDLDDRDKQRLIGEHPSALGNLDGMPVDVRDKINVAVMQDDIHRVQDAAGRAGVTVDDVLKHPQKYGLSASDATAYANACKVADGLAHQRGRDGRNPVYLFGFKPLEFGGQGAAAIAIGNPDTADNVAVIVPGTGSSVSSGWLSSDRNDALSLLDQMSKADPAKTNSVMLWMGYDAPDSFLDPRLPNHGLARIGGDLLASDVNSFGVTHVGANTPNITVLGHSYGSTTVADAFANSNMHATNAVLLGCPGTDLATSAASFHLPPGHVFVGDASTDPIGWIGESNGAATGVNEVLHRMGIPDLGLGADPAAQTFGAVRFEAEVPGSDGLNGDDHSYYYTMGSESLHGMATIASGHGDALRQIGALAGERTPMTVGVKGPTIDLPFGLGEIHVPGVDVQLPGDLWDPEWQRAPSSVTATHVFDQNNHF